MKLRPENTVNYRLTEQDQPLPKIKGYEFPEIYSPSGKRMFEVVPVVESKIAMSASVSREKPPRIFKRMPIK